ncbi:MAG: glycosyltransferase family 4 protein [Gammaproteobacteria bacterium]|nr:glycosyltransferase family 4 protein [Gammaproteobacteria bacterium]
MNRSPIIYHQEEPMRIWIINHYALPPTTAGGTRHYNFARQLQRRGHDVLVIAANYNHITQSFVAEKDQCEKINTRFDVPFYWIPVPAYKGNTLARFYNMLSFSWQLIRSKNTLLKKIPAPDVIIGSSPHLFSAFAAQKLAQQLHKPFILEVRDIWPDTLVELGRFTSKHALIKGMKWIELYLYRHADKIISLLPCSSNYFIQSGVKEKNILWLPNAIDSAIIETELLEKKPDQTFTFMYAGAHGMANDLETVVNAAKILQAQPTAHHIKISLIGEGPVKLRLKQMASEATLNNITFMDPVPKKNIYNILNQADAYLMLLKDSPVFRWGISPNKLFDYMMMAKPIIFGVNTPHNPIQISQAGISIPPSDPKALAEAMIKLASLPNETRNSMGARGKEYVLKHHEIGKLTNKLESCINELI